MRRPTLVSLCPRTILLALLVAGVAVVLLAAGSAQAGIAKVDGSNATQTIHDPVSPSEFEAMAKAAAKLTRPATSVEWRAYRRARRQATGPGVGSPPARRTPRLWRVGPGHTAQVDPADDPAGAKILARVELALDALWNDYGQNGCDGVGGAPDVVLPAANVAPEAAPATGYFPPQALASLQPGVAEQLGYELRSLGVPLDVGRLMVAAPDDSELAIAHEIGHCLSGARTLHEVDEYGLRYRDGMEDTALDEGLADLNAYNQDPKATSLAPGRDLLPNPLPRAADFTCGAPYENARLLVAAYGQVARRLDARGAPHFNAQRLYIWTLQRHLTARSTLADARAKFVAAARELWPTAYHGTRPVSVVEQAFDRVGLTAGWAPPTCPA